MCVYVCVNALYMCACGFLKHVLMYFGEFVCRSVLAIVILGYWSCLGNVIAHL